MKRSTTSAFNHTASAIRRSLSNNASRKNSRNLCRKAVAGAKRLAFSALLLQCLVAAPNADAATVTIDGGTYTASNPYQGNSSSADAYVFTNGGYFLSNTDNTTFSGSFSGSGNIQINSTSGRPQIHFSSAMDDYAGTVQISGAAWFSINDPNRGAADSRWILKANDHSTGILLNKVTSSADDPIQFGTIEGYGAIRPLGNLGNRTYYIEVGNLMEAGKSYEFSGNIYNHNGDDVHVTKVGAGTWILTGLNTNGAYHVKEGTLQVGNNGGNGKLDENCSVVVEAGAALGYSRQKWQNSPLDRNESILIKGGSLYMTGEQQMRMTNVTFENGGYVKSYSQSGNGLIIHDLNLTGDDENARVVFTTSTDGIYLTGSLTGNANQEIYLTGIRGKWLTLDLNDASNFHGVITAGPSTESVNNGTWVELTGSTLDFSNVTFNPNSGQGVDAGFLLNYTPSDAPLKIGAVSGNGIIRTNQEGTYNIQVGYNNEDSLFTGGIVIFGNSNYNIEKVGTGRWIIASPGSTQPGTTNGKFEYNNYTGTTTITEGVLQLGDYDPATGKGGNNGWLGNSSITDSSKLTKIIVAQNATLAFARIGTDVSYYNNIEVNGGTIEVVNREGDYVVLRGAVVGNFTKTGSGTLALGSSNGDKLTSVTVKEGTLRNYGADRIGDGKTQIILDGGAFEEMNSWVWLNNTFNILSDSSIIARAPFTISSELRGNSNAVLTIAGGNKLTLTGETNNYKGTYRVTDSSTLQIGSNNNAWINNTSPIVVDKGSAFGYNRDTSAGTSAIQPTNAITLGGTLFNSGKRDLDFQNVSVTSDGATFQNSGEARLVANVKKVDNAPITLDGNADDSVELRFNTSAGRIDVNGFNSTNDYDSIIYFNAGGRGNFLNLTGDMSNFHGTVKVEGNRWFSFGSGTALGSEYAVFDTNMTSDSGLLFNTNALAGKTVKMGDLTGNGYVRNGDMGGTVNLEVGALGNDNVFSGYLGRFPDRNDQHLNVVKVGSGVWTLASDNQVNGKTYDNTADFFVREGTLELKRKANQASAKNMTIEGGTLLVSDDNQKITGSLTLNGGALYVAEGKTFSHSVINVGGGKSTVSALNGNIVGNVNVNDGQLRIGNPVNITGNLALTNGSLLSVDVKGPNVADRVKINGKVILDSSSKIGWILPEDMEDLEYFELFTADEIVMDDGTPVIWEAVLENLDDWIVLEEENEFGEVVLALATHNAVPEPASWAILVLGAFGLAFLRKKRTAK